jgi:hypothetical protein
VEGGEEGVVDREVEGVAEVAVSEGEEVAVVVDLIIEVGVVEEEVGEVLEEEEDGTDNYCTFTKWEEKNKYLLQMIYHPYWVLNRNS